MRLKSAVYWAFLGCVGAGCGDGGASLAGGAGGGAGSHGAAGAGGSVNAAPFDCDEPESMNCPSVPPDRIDDERPAAVVVPSDYTTDTAYPLVIVLHGNGSFGSANSLYLGATQRVDSLQFVLVTPDASPDVDGVLGWNAGAIVLEFPGEPPDDRAYVRRLIDEAKRAYRIDDARIYLLGTSNGGHLALDLICEDPSVATAVLNQAGALPMEAACNEGVTSLLSVHGTADDTVAFGGGTRENGIVIYSAVALVAAFAENTGCGPVENTGSIDLVDGLPGAETRVQRYGDCVGGAEHALWAVQQAPHTPNFSEDARDLWFDWLLAQVRADN